MSNKTELLKAKHILVNQEYEAKDILKKINDGAEFEKLAQDFSMCPSGKNGGDLGEFPRGRMIPIFEKALLDMTSGQVSGIVKTQFGFHIIKRL
jgi:peptidyl-prolyl cis-trans isomerase C